MIKTPEEIVKMRVAGQMAASVLDVVQDHVKAGITTEELDDICHRYIVDGLKAYPAPLHYNGFPKATCISVNHVACHGIPKDRILKRGDIVNIDITVIKDGYHGDTSRMFFVGAPSVLAFRLCRAAAACLYLGIDAAQPGARLGDIGAAIEENARRYGYSVVEEFCGHGIGQGFHEEPMVLHFGTKGTGLELVPGMTFTIEPILNVGKRDVKVLKDGWTVVTRDKSLSAQYEHTILITDDGNEILTLSGGV